MRRIFTVLASLGLLWGALSPISYSNNPVNTSLWYSKSEHLLAQKGTEEHQDSKIPLILVHGIAPMPQKLYSWELFLKEAALHQAFQEQFQVYLFHYDPTQPVSQNGQLLAQELKNAFIRTQPACRLRVVAHSMGGWSFFMHYRTRKFRHVWIKQLPWPPRFMGLRWLPRTG